MLYIAVNEFMLHDLMRKAGRDNFSEEGYEWIVNEYSNYYDDVEFYPVDVDSQFCECSVSEAVANYGYLMDPDDYTDDDGNIDPWMFIIAFSGHTNCDLLSNDNIIYEVF